VPKIPSRKWSSSNLHGMIENRHSEFQRKNWALNGQLCSRT
jgi:hypothetical protein